MSKSRKQQLVAKAPEESRHAEVTTIAWMLSVVTTLFCELGSLVAWVFLRFQPESAWVGLLSRYLLAAAAIIGVISLLLAVGVFKLRRVPPPPGIMGFALAIGLAPAPIAVLMSLD